MTIFDFLPFYAILRSIPSKLGGVVGMFAAILILFALPFLDVSRVRGNAFKPIIRFFFWIFVANFWILAWIGGNHAEEPFITIGQYSTIFYFSYFLIIVPITGFIENTLIDLATLNKTSRNSPPPFIFNSSKKFIAHTQVY
jgi:ubiquinol-cytochrome c reductase cytochrome b subunit